MDIELQDFISFYKKNGKTSYQSLQQIQNILQDVLPKYLSPKSKSLKNLTLEDNGIFYINQVNLQHYLVFQDVSGDFLEATTEKGSFLNQMFSDSRLKIISMNVKRIEIMNHSVI